MTKKEVRFGFISKTQEDFLYMTEDQRFKKYGYGVNKYYQRIVYDTKRAISDLIFAYENLPDLQKEKIDLVTDLDLLTDYVSKKELEGTPEKIILTTKKQLYAIFQSYILFKPIQKLAKEDFDKVANWLEYLTPKRKEQGAPIL